MTGFWLAKTVRKGEIIAASDSTDAEIMAKSTEFGKRGIEMRADPYAFAIWRRMETKRLENGGEVHGYTGRNNNR